MADAQSIGDQARLAQIPAGKKVRFTMTTREQALEEMKRWRSDLTDFQTQIQLRK